MTLMGVLEPFGVLVVVLWFGRVGVVLEGAAGSQNVPSGG
jgi:hypothetical protein